MPVERKSFTGTEIRAGLMVLLSGAILLVFIGAVLRYRIPGESKTFHVSMADIGGLDRAAEVRFGGMVVGRVTNIGPDPANHTRMVVTAEVERDVPVNTASTAYAGQITLTSEKHLEITTGAPEATLLEDGANIPASAGGGGMFGDLTALTASLDRLLADVTLLLGVSDREGKTVFIEGESRTVADLFNTLDDTLTDLRVVVGVVDEHGDVVAVEDRKTLTEIMDNLDGAVTEGQALLTDVRDVLAENREGITEVLDAVKKVGASADSLVTNLDEMIAENRESIDKTLAGAGEAMEKINVLMVDMQALVASLQEIMERNSPEFDELFSTLNDTLRNLEELTRMLADQPQSIIRGREPVGRP